jgi:N-acetylglucosamine kinase-like BadF-type ATPase
MSLVMGIDGGGSGVRAAVVTTDLEVLGQSTGSTVNPSVIGRAAAAERIQTVVLAALESAQVAPEQIAAIGAGVAGAAKEHSETWLHEMLASVLPSSKIVASSDLEIALVGARGERRGIVILAGTGSAAYGVNVSGASTKVGGWGYLLGDEGSGYWIGLEGLRHIARAADSTADESRLSPVLLKALGLNQPRDLIPWLYRSETPRNREIAALAPLVLHAAENGDASACDIVSNAAAWLAQLGQAAARKLEMDAPAYVFAGGLLESPNILSEKLCELLTLANFPERRYSPVIGAALLALLHLSQTA